MPKIHQKFKSTRTSKETLFKGKQQLWNNANLNLNLAEFLK